jgi:hypothetical protein
VRGFEQGPVNENLSLPGSSSLERVTGIEPALSAWESVPFGPMQPDLRCDRSTSDREYPRITRVNGTLMARGGVPDLRRLYALLLPVPSTSADP